MNIFSTISLVCISAFLLSACQPKDVDLPIDSQTPSSQGTSSADTATTSATQVGTVNDSSVSSSENAIDEPVRNDMGVIVDEFGIPKHTVFYFEFDKFGIHSADLDTLASHGQYIANSPTARVRLEGHTDERGSREYNIALGENRAKSIARILQLQGVRSEQVMVISLGEEQPADIGHNENSWALNRRVEIIYEIR